MKIRKQNPLREWRKETILVQTTDKDNNVKFQRRHKLFYQSELKKEFSTLKELHHFLKVNVTQPIRR